MFTFGSLFSGIGGIDLGFEMAGMSCLWQVEKDPFCQKVLNKHWPNVTKFEDVRNVGKHNLEPVDLIAGGFPCQPHSLAGKRKGKDDDRNLWPEYRRIVGELKPTWVVGENVPGIKTTILDDVLSDLEGLDYQTRTLIIPACALGAPHIRERVFILAHSNSLGRSGQAARQSAFHQERNNPAHQSRRETELYEAFSGCKVSMQTYDSGQWWAVEPRVGRVADGISNRVDRLRSLGNAVVPQVAEWLGLLIMAVAQGDFNSSPVFYPHVMPVSNIV